MFAIVLIVGVGAIALYEYSKYVSTSQSVASSLGTEAVKAAETLPVVGKLFVSNASIQRIGLAIASAEGFYVSGARPQRNNNPGDLKGNFSGTAIGSDESGFDIFLTAQDGWNALYRQITLWLTNKSNYAGQETTIRQLASVYTTTDQGAWSANVSRALGVPDDTKLGDIA